MDFFNLTLQSWLLIIMAFAVYVNVIIIYAQKKKLKQKLNTENHLNSPDEKDCYQIKRISYTSADAVHNMDGIKEKVLSGIAVETFENLSAPAFSTSSLISEKDQFNKEVTKVGVMDSADRDLRPVIGEDPEAGNTEIPSEIARVFANFVQQMSIPKNEMYSLIDEYYERKLTALSFDNIGEFKSVMNDPEIYEDGFKDEITLSYLVGEEELPVIEQTGKKLSEAEQQIFIKSNDGSGEDFSFSIKPVRTDF